MTKTQLAELHHPRSPGPVAATVRGVDGIGRKTVIDLHLIAESTPSSATIRQLKNAANRQHPHRYRCTQCGAHTNLPTTDPSTPAEGVRLCRACAHIDRIQTAQRLAATARSLARTSARDLLDDPRTTIVHAHTPNRGVTQGGYKRPPTSSTITCLDTNGHTLLDLTVRLGGPRTQDVPNAAIWPGEAATTIREVLTDRHLLLWSVDRPLKALHEVFYRNEIPGPFPTGYAAVHDLWHLSLQWRGDLDPRTTHTIPPVPPGDAHRMLYLLQQIAGAA
ncbi:hypothetical protein [Streptomyces sp. NPDC050738]|uniref:hypothetical protein n=1 Tax=Streptomyces sp. NPDC050738 TaxID=3154744 RepID=UPI0034242759